MNLRDLYLTPKEMNDIEDDLVYSEPVEALVDIIANAATRKAVSGIIAWLRAESKLQPTDAFYSLNILAEKLERSLDEPATD